MKPISVLLVEDDEMLAQLYQERLSIEGWRVVLALNGNKGKEELVNKKNKFDLILLDIMLPGLNGLDLLAWVRTESDNKTIPVVVFSVLYTDEDKARAMALGANDYITKSESTPEEVIKTIKKFVQHQRHRKGG